MDYECTREREHMICGGCVEFRTTRVAVLREHWRVECPVKADWLKVIAERRAGNDDAAARLARKLMGVQGPPMSEETKERLRRYQEEHAEEIKARRELQAASDRRLRQIMKPSRRR